MIRSVSVVRSSPFQAALSDMDTHAGYLEKQQPNFLKSWQRRFWVLENRMLKYYKNDSDYLNKLPPKGVINFEQVSVDLHFTDDLKKINLLIKGCTRTFFLRCSDPDHYKIWKTKLEHSVAKSVGKQKGLSMVSYN